MIVGKQKIRLFPPEHYAQTVTKYFHTKYDITASRRRTKRKYKHIVKLKKIY